MNAIVGGTDEKPTCLAPRTMGMRTSGSVACVDSSTRTCWKRKFCSLGSPAPTQVEQTTSACSRISASRRLWGPVSVGAG